MKILGRNKDILQEIKNVLSLVPVRNGKQNSKCDYWEVNINIESILKDIQNAINCRVFFFFKSSVGFWPVFFCK